MEFVFVVPRDRIFPDSYPQGLVPFGDGFGVDAFLDAVRQHGFFVEREKAERTPQWKQVIPYSVATSDGRVLLMRRLPTGGERRLHDKLSIGVGGHINPEDSTPQETRAGRTPQETRAGRTPQETRAGRTPQETRAGRTPQETRAGSTPSGSDATDPLAAGTARELAEELEITGSFSIRPIGILNDDSNPVGAVHLGLVQVLELEGSVDIRERDVLEGRLVPARELSEMLTQGANFETWSALLVERIHELLPAPRPALL